MANGNGKVPVNVVMGELGSGKTTVIMGLVKQIAGPDHQVIWLKNEYGDVNVDSKLAEEAGIKTQEIMNGCLCCTAIGNLEDALEQIMKMEPDRVIVETAGTAHPAPIAMELKRFGDIVIDSFTEVIDAENFAGFTEPPVIRQSYTKYVDFVILNKTGLVDSKRLDEVLDQIYEAYSGLPLFRTEDGLVSAEAVIGLKDGAATSALKLEEVESDVKKGPHEHMEWFSFHSTRGVFDQGSMEGVLNDINRRDIWRIKGIVRTADGWKVMNSVFSRTTWQDYSAEAEETAVLFIGPFAKEHQETVIEKLEGLVR